ncbi:MAG: hypothetical protein VB137_15900 [Burkholderia sp.]
MSHTIPATGKPFGLQRVCQVLDFSPLHDLCRARQGAQQGHPTCPCPTWPEAQGAGSRAARADLTRTPFVGEGACKVWARLRIQDDIRVSRARVSPLMRANTACFRPIGNRRNRPMLTMLE